MTNDTQDIEHMIRALLVRIEVTVLDKPMYVKLHRDGRHKPGRLYLQATWSARDTTLPHFPITDTRCWASRKWYLSDFMTADEIVKTAWLCVQQAVQHEMMEGFKVDGKAVFNPHVNFEALLSVADHTVQRDDHASSSSS